MTKELPDQPDIDLAEAKRRLEVGQRAQRLRAATHAALSRAARTTTDALDRQAGLRASVSRAEANAPRPTPNHTSRGSIMSDDNNKTPSSTDAQPEAGGNGSTAAGKSQAGGSIFTEPTPGGTNKTVATVMGEIVWLFSQSPRHKNFFISDLEWLVMTPVLLKQFRMFYAPDRPIGVALWGYVNDAAEERLKTGNARLAPADWKSGEKLWLVDIVAPFGGHDAMIKDLKEKVFPEREVKFLKVEGGKPAVKGI